MFPFHSSTFLMQHTCNVYAHSDGLEENDISHSPVCTKAALLTGEGDSLTLLHLSSRAIFKALSGSPPRSCKKDIPVNHLSTLPLSLALYTVQQDGIMQMGCVVCNILSWGRRGMLFPRTVSLLSSP
jgi:hypothetical protein